MNNTKYVIPLLALVLLIPLGMSNVIAQEIPGEEESGEVGTVNEENKKTKDDDIEPQTNETYQSHVNELTKQEFKDDIQELLGDEDFQAKSNEIKAEYDEFFSTVIEQARIDSETRTLTNAEIIAVKDYIFDETIKDEKLKALQKSNSANKIDVNFLEWFGIQTASAVCPSTTHPNYKQLQIDINGGSIGWLYNFNGGNDLYLVSYDDNSTDCERVYSLYFYDEDHPILDTVYDRVRIIMYDRIHDIEMFTIKNNSQIEFDDTWSSSNGYDCLDLLQRGCHSTITKSYTPGQTIYVSNTWNHMMDTSDTNRSLSKVSVP